MAVLKFFVISCSSEIEMDIRSLYVWGESQFQGGLPGTAKEAYRRILECRKKMKCLKCDAEMHKIKTERKTPITFPKNFNHLHGKSTAKDGGRMNGNTSEIVK